MNTENIAVTEQEETEWKMKEAELNSVNPCPFYSDKELVNELCKRLDCSRATLLDTVDALEREKDMYRASLITQGIS